MMIEWIFTAYLLTVQGQWVSAPPLVMQDEAACDAMAVSVEKAGLPVLLNMDPDIVQSWATYCLPFEVKALPAPKAPPVGPVSPATPKPAALEIAI